MKDARGHGSNKGPLPGAAAHRSVVQKLYQNGEHHQAMAHALTRYDREQEHKGKDYNTYALGHYMGAVERVMSDIRSGTSHADAINNHTNGAVANRLHTAMNTGAKARKY